MYIIFLCCFDDNLFFFHKTFEIPLVVLVLNLGIQLPWAFGLRPFPKVGRLWTAVDPGNKAGSKTEIAEVSQA